MAAEENKKLIRDAFEAWGAGEDRAFFALVAEDVRWTVIGTTSISGTYTSLRDFQAVVATLTAKLEGGIRPSVRSILADGDLVAVQWEASARTVSGGAYDQKYSWVMRLEQGKVREVTAYLDTQLLCDVLA